MCPLQRPSQKTTKNALQRCDDGEAASRRARLEQLRAALENGSYRPQVRLIAERMLTSGDLA